MAEPHYELEDVPTTFALTMRVRVSPDQVSEALGWVLPACFQSAVDRGLGPGRPFARYRTVRPDELELDAGVVVSEPGTSDGDIKATQLPSCRAAVVMHVGPYEDLPASHRALVQWAKDNGHDPAPGPWEVYITDPSEQPDPSTWQTRLYLPLR